MARSDHKGPTPESSQPMTFEPLLLGGRIDGKWVSERIWLQLMARATVQKTRVGWVDELDRKHNK